MFYDTSKIEFIFDGVRQKWVELKKETQEIRIVEEKYIRKYLYNHAKEFYIQNEKKVLYELPMRDLIFNPFKSSSWNKDTIEYQNIYIESEIALKAKEKRNQSLSMRKKDFTFLERSPHIQALLNNILPVEEERNFFLNWLSYIFTTKKKTRTAIVIMGIQRTGKGVFWEQIIQYFFGNAYTPTLENEHVKGRFTPTAIEQAIFVLCNEVKADFRDGNNAYERLKMWISDLYMRIEQKSQNDREAPNFFNMLFFSNNSVPLQIQGSDGRYSVFKTKSRKLKEVAEEDFKISIVDFIDNVQKERDNFLIDLVCYDYDEELATTTLETTIKETIYKASMTKIEILADKIKTLNEDFFTSELLEIAEHLKTDEMESIIEDTKNVGVYDTYNKLDIRATIISIFNEMKNDLISNAYIKNKSAIFYYKLFISATENFTKIGTSLNSHLASMPVQKSVGKVRVIEEFKDANYIKKFIPF